jgi:hypothetical protein
MVHVYHGTDYTYVRTYVRTYTCTYLHHGSLLTAPTLGRLLLHIYHQVEFRHFSHFPPLPLCSHPARMADAVDAVVGRHVATVHGVFRRRLDLGGELPREQMEAQKAKAGYQIFQRIRTAREGEAPAGVGPLGLTDSLEYHRFLCARESQPLANAGERAVLVQSAAHVDELRQFAATATPPLVQPVAPEAFFGGAVGENVFVHDVEGGGGGSSVSSSVSSSAFCSATVCVGDEYDVVRRSGGDEGEQRVVCRLQVASPRLPCSKWDTTFGQTFTARGVRAEAARSGLGGIFCRVLQSGTLLDGDTLRLAKRPHPAWNLRRISRLCYGSDVAVMR